MELKHPKQLTDQSTANICSDACKKRRSWRGITGWESDGIKSPGLSEIRYTQLLATPRVRQAVEEAVKEA